MTSVAVIGGGVAGMGAARELAQAGLSVVLVESSGRLGGNCLGVTVRDRQGREFRVDAGVSDFNRTTFRQVSRLIDGLGLPTHPIGTDADFVGRDGSSRAWCRDGRWSFGAGVRDADRLVQEVDAFRVQVSEVLEDPRFVDWSVGRYLDHLGASRALRELILYPRAMGCFPMPDQEPRDLSVVGLASFWTIHGVVGRAPARRHCVVGGMHRYAAAFQRSLEEQGVDVRCGLRVIGVARRSGGVEVRAVDRDDRHHRLPVDHVVLTGHAHDALALLEEPSAEERDVLGRFTYQRARVVVHRDERLMGRDRETWGAFNYVVPEGRWPRVKPTITFFPNRLARLPAEVPDVFVTMNPHREPHRPKVLVDRFFLHPIADSATRAAIPRVERLQGRRRTWFAGGWLVMPFVHESALVSGQQAARRLLRAEAGVAPRRRRAAV